MLHDKEKTNFQSEQEKYLKAVQHYLKRAFSGGVTNLNFLQHLERNRRTTSLILR